MGKDIKKIFLVLIFTILYSVLFYVSILTIDNGMSEDNQEWVSDEEHNGEYVEDANGVYVNVKHEASQLGMAYMIFVFSLLLIGYLVTLFLIADI